MALIQAPGKPLSSQFVEYREGNGERVRMISHYSVRRFRGLDGLVFLPGLSSAWYQLFECFEITSIEKGLQVIAFTLGCRARMNHEAEIEVHKP
jgi:hypothetical protein